MSDAWIGLAVALGVGLLVGLDRERRKGQGPQREAAGLRTFALVTVAGALAQSLAPGLLVAVGALAVAALAVVAYWRSQQVPLTQSDPGLTTEVALVVAYLVGVQCAVQPAVGAACGAVLAALLAARERMHRFATEWLTDEELRDALVLAGVALVVVPLAPTTPLPGLGGLAPRTAAWLVLVILSLQAAAHIAQRLFGERHALMAAGLLGGFVSSTATIATFGARVHSASTTMRPRLAAAASLSAVATWLQALVMAAVVSPGLLPRLAPVALAGALGALLVGARRSRDEPSDPATTATASNARPLRLREAFAVASLLLVVSIVMGWLEAKFGRQGLFAGSALAALADAHAPIAAAFSLHAQGTIDAGAAVQVLVLAVAVNSASRCVVALVAGGIGYAARVGAALIVSVLAAVLGLMLAARLITLVA